MIYQVWFSENTLPVLTQEQRDTYRGLVLNQIIPIGNEVAGRRLIRCMTSDFLIIEDFLNSIGKEVIICGAKDIDNNFIEGFSCNIAEFDKFFAPIEIDQDGIIIELIPPDNTSAGWPSFKE